MRIDHISDWYGYRDPGPLFRMCNDALSARLLTHAGSDTRSNRRQLQYFAVACSQLTRHLLPGDAGSALTMAERFLWGNATLDDLRAVTFGRRPISITAHHHAINALGSTLAVLTHDDGLDGLTDDVSRSAAKALATQTAGQPTPNRNPHRQETWSRAYVEARALEADLFRDILPPPRVLIPIERDWLSTDVVELVHWINTRGDYSALPLLADALDDAGCRNDLILHQCRHDGPHVRGNWVIELLLENIA